MAASPSIEEDLETLLTAIKNLPASAQSGCHSDPLGKYLTPGLTKGNNPEPAFPSHKDGAYLYSIINGTTGPDPAQFNYQVQYDNDFMTAALAPLVRLSTTDPDSAEEEENDSADKNEDQSKKRKKADATTKGPKKKAKKAVAEGGDVHFNFQCTYLTAQSRRQRKCKTRSEQETNPVDMAQTRTSAATARVEPRHLDIISLGDQHYLKSGIVQQKRRRLLHPLEHLIRILK
ncbi:hypothetical protein B0H14DRAFT_3705468 [Mycena olivaceomarginata]|nr:hypothetical protein B0H14DRAFT_3705468 [Mycena olivaceomarginata]